MRKNSSCVVTVRRFGTWRWAVTVLAGAALATLVAWATAMRAALVVALDLGSFLLLTLAAPGRRRRRWLPVRRRGLAGEWQALRRAAYSPPLAAAETLAVNENPPG
jgi:hypothetical protein